jgi:cell pole-organizing protein PopZ
MDDILASIRRILNEDDGAAPAAGGKPAGGAPPADEPLELTESMMITPVSAAPPSEPEPPRAAAEPLPAEPVELPASMLVAPAVAAAATASVGKLLRTVAQERAATVSRGGPSIEDVVREELRPLLKEWLELHLPPMVERLVRAEIERVVGRAMP